jgi:hypothetical protein
MRTGLLRISISLLLASIVPAKAQNRAEIDMLRAQIANQETEVANQEKEIQRLRVTLEAQKRLLDQLVPTAPSERPQVEAVTVPPTAFAVQRVLPGAQAANTSTASPWTFHLGSFALTPGGFLDLTTSFRTTVVGSGIATNFNNIPFSNMPAGRLTETRPSAQNSRISFRAKTCVGRNPADEKCKDGTGVTSYLEADFSGFQPVNGVVTSNSNGPRLRLFWVDLRRGAWEVLAGQSYSFLTPNRVGISPEPKDLFLTQVVDPNFHVGLTWTRAPQIRFACHHNETWSIGVAFENPEQFVGNGVTLPAALATPYSTQVDPALDGKPLRAFLEFIEGWFADG